MHLAGRQLTLKGFVTTKGQEWFLTQFEISCCAADAAVVRVRVSGHPAPPRDQWVEVTGTWLQGTGRTSDEPVALEADRVVEILPPREVYG